MTQDATPAWSRYWATGVGHSCAGSFDQVYGGALGAFWQEAFQLLPAGARVLDLACGNGALARLLTAVRDDTALRCDAVDIAQLRPDWARGEPRLRFHPGTPAEALPFANASFDLVASQYGIEYADLPRALAEALRVLKPTGLAHFVVHHQDGRPCVLAREELSHVRWLTRDDGWFDAATGMLEPLSLLTQPDGRAQLEAEPRFLLVRQRFDRLVTEAVERGLASDCGDLLDDVRDWTSQVFRIAGTRGRAAALPAMETVRQRVEDVRARLNDLVDHALDEQAIVTVSQAARDAGHACHAARVQDRGHLMGVALTLHRA